MPESPSAPDASEVMTSDAAADRTTHPLGQRRTLPSRHPDARRPKVQGLNPGATELRRRQATTDNAPPPSDATHLGVLAPWGPTLAATLRAVATEHVGIESGLLCTSAGSPVASHGVPEEQVARAAAATSALYGTASAPQVVDHVVVQLPEAGALVVADAGTAQTPLLVRLHLDRGVDPTLLRVLLARTVDDLAESVRDAEAAARPSRFGGEAPAQTESSSTSAAE